ncbi:MAG: hypothetical protein EPO07_00075, partial [Verrucomicrobia bacterium]
MKTTCSLRVFWVVAFLISSLSSRAQTLGEALNAANFTWITTGNALWSGQTTTSHDGDSAARAGTINSAGQSSALQTTVTGPGTLTFWWQHKPSNGFTTDLGFKVDGVTQTNLSLYNVWQPYTNYLSDGVHILQWVFTNSSSSTLGEAYVDEFTYTTGSTVPFITDQPRSQSQVQRLDAKFNVHVGGTPPMGYQWIFWGTNLPGATASGLIVTNVQITNLGDYGVIVTNSSGSVTSSIATLEFGHVTAWGFNDYGQTSVARGATNIATLGAGYYHGIFARTDGSLGFWGTDSDGQMQPPAGLTDVIAVAGGFAHTTALRSNGTVVAWGNNANGQTNVPNGLSNVVAIAAGDNHSICLKSDGTVASWGVNLFGVTNVPASVSNIISIAAGQYFNLALKDNGTVTFWGLSMPGNSSVIPNLSNVVAVAGGGSHAIALRDNGAVVAWGQNTAGQTNVPPDLTNVIAIRAGYNFSLALTAAGKVVAWGSNQLGQTNVPSALTNVVAVTAVNGGYFAVAAVGDEPPKTQAQLLYPVLNT